MADCVKDLVEGVLGLTPREAALVIRDLNQAMAADRAARHNPQAMAELAKTQAGTYKHEAKLAKVRAQKKEIALADLMGRTRNFKNPGEGVMGTMVGHTRYATVTDVIPGGLDSIAVHQIEMQAFALEGFKKDMEAGGFKGIFKRLQKDQGFVGKVARELEAVLGGKSVSGDPEAFHAAGVIEKHWEKWRMLANQAGADIEKMPAYIGFQSHESGKMAKAGFPAWREFIKGRLDDERTFKGQEPDKVLEHIYNKIILNESGVYAPAESMGGGSSLANRLSNRRFLHFKNADAAMEYHSRFGDGTFWEGIVRKMTSTSKAVATMQRMGSNPNDTFRTWSALEAKAALVSGKPISPGMGHALENTFMSLTGADNVAVSLRMSTIGQWMRQAMTMAKLGLSMLSSFSDIPNYAAAARYNGRGWMQGYGDAFGGLLGMVPTAQRSEFAGYLGTFADGVLGATWGRIAADDMRPGMMTKAVNAYFKLNGLGPWTERLKIGYMWTQARVLGDNHQAAWGSLDDYFRNQLTRYGIGEEGWSKLSKVAPGEVNGTRYLTPDLLEGVDGALAHKVRAWMLSESEFAIPTPGVRERSLMLQGTRAGTGPGEVMRFMAQFKTFSTTVMLRSVPRAWDMGVPGVVNLAVTGSIFGGLSLWAKDIAGGKKPRDFTDPRNTLAAFMQSGGIGLLGDMAVADFSGYNRSILQFAAGPVGGAAQDIASLYSKAVRGEDFGASALQFGKNNLPGGNLFYLKGAINYLVLYQIMEDMNPGSLRRMERLMKKETGQEYMFPPSRAVR